jgi:hypothetical protein
MDIRFLYEMGTLHAAAWFTILPPDIMEDNTFVFTARNVSF